MGQRHILHCDCNCFYASVEMQEHPELRGKSIAVCGDPEARHGIVLTASYPAKRMGVKTGMPIWEAKQHCRDLIIVPASYGKYQKYSGYVREVFNDYTDQVESFGLDEAWLDITGSLGLFGDPVKIAKEISDRIKRELGITVSIGVSFNKITAKLGSDYKKPDAITVIEPDTYKQIVYPLPVGDLLYVGNATQRKLGSYGIRTIGQLAGTNPEVLKGWFGVMGYTLSAFARGLDQTPVAKQDAHSAIKSVGNSATTPRDLTTDEDVWLMLGLLSESVAMRMRDLGSKCNVVEIYVRDNELSGFTPPKAGQPHQCKYRNCPHVGGHFRTGIALERGIGQAYCADQVTPRCEILAHVLGFLIHRAGGCDERHNAADTQFIYRLG